MSNVIVINPFEVPEGMESEALKSWDTFAEYFSQQPGYVSTRLHRALTPDARFQLVNVAEWKNAEEFQAALTNPELQNIMAGMENEIPHFPGLYEVIRQ